MSIFGDIETPAAKKPEPPAGQLSDLTLKVHNAVYDPSQSCVLLRAAAQTAFSDGRVEAGIVVAFFLNGERFSEVKTDDFGLAELACNLPAHQCRNATNVLTARVRGFAKEAQVQFTCPERSLVIKTVDHRWDRIVQVKRFYETDAGFYDQKNNHHDYSRFEGLTVRIRAEVTSPPWSLDGVFVELVSVGHDGPSSVVASGKFGSQGSCVLTASDCFYDDPNVVSAIGTGNQNGEYRSYSQFGSVRYACYYEGATAQLPASKNLWGRKVVVRVPVWPEAMVELRVGQQGNLIPS